LSLPPIKRYSTRYDKPDDLTKCSKNNTETGTNGKMTYMDPITFDPIDPMKNYILNGLCYNIDSLYNYLITNNQYLTMTEAGKVKDIHRNVINKDDMTHLFKRYFEVHNSVPIDVIEWVKENRVSLVKLYGTISKVAQETDKMIDSIREKYANQSIHELKDTLEALNIKEPFIIYKDKTNVYLYTSHANTYTWIIMDKRAKTVKLVKPLEEEEYKFPKFKELIATLTDSLKKTNPMTDKERLDFIARLNHLNVKNKDEKEVQDYIDTYFKVPLNGLSVSYDFITNKDLELNEYVSILVYNSNFPQEDKPIFEVSFDYDNKDRIASIPNDIRYYATPYNINFNIPNKDKYVERLKTSMSYTFNRLNAEDTKRILTLIQEEHPFEADLEMLKTPRGSRGGGKRAKRVSNLETLTVKELQGRCKERKIVYSGLRKEALIQRLRKK
jgi:hypothetical protein